VPELLARMRVAVRRANPRDLAEAAATIRSGDVEIDLARRLVRRDQEEVHLTPTEYGVLRYLAEHATRVVTHGQLLRAVMGPGYADAVGSLRVYVAGLRKKLEADPTRPRIIITEPGVGYRFRAD
jgi:two-component system KDP operon response regulator KdpE